MKDEPQGRKSIGALEIGFQRRLKERQRRVQTPALVIDLSKTKQRVEILGMLLQRLRIEPLRLVDSPCSCARNARRSIRDRFGCMCCGGLPSIAA